MLGLRAFANSPGLRNRILISNLSSLDSSVSYAHACYVGKYVNTTTYVGQLATMSPITPRLAPSSEASAPGIGIRDNARNVLVKSAPVACCTLVSVKQGVDIKKIERCWTRAAKPPCATRVPHLHCIKQRNHQILVAVVLLLQQPELHRELSVGFPSARCLHPHCRAPGLSTPVHIYLPAHV